MEFTVTQLLIYLLLMRSASSHQHETSRLEDISSLDSFMGKVDPKSSDLIYQDLDNVGGEENKVSSEEIVASFNLPHLDGTNLNSNPNLKVYTAKLRKVNKEDLDKAIVFNLSNDIDKTNIDMYRSDTCNNELENSHLKSQTVYNYNNNIGSNNTPGAQETVDTSNEVVDINEIEFHIPHTTSVEIGDNNDIKCNDLIIEDAREVDLAINLNEFGISKHNVFEENAHIKDKEKTVLETNIGYISTEHFKLVNPLYNKEGNYFEVTIPHDRSIKGTSDKNIPAKSTTNLYAEVLKFNNCGYQEARQISNVNDLGKIGIGLSQVQEQPDNSYECSVTNNIIPSYGCMETQVPPNSQQESDLLDLKTIPGNHQSPIFMQANRNNLIRKLKVANIRNNTDRKFNLNVQADMTGINAGTSNHVLEIQGKRPNNEAFSYPTQIYDINHVAEDKNLNKKYINSNNARYFHFDKDSIDNINEIDKQDIILYYDQDHGYGGTVMIDGRSIYGDKPANNVPMNLSFADYNVLSPQDKFKDSYYTTVIYPNRNEVPMISILHLLTSVNNVLPSSVYNETHYPLLHEFTDLGGISLTPDHGLMTMSLNIENQSPKPKDKIDIREDTNSNENKLTAILAAPNNELSYALRSNDVPILAINNDDNENKPTNTQDMNYIQRVNNIDTTNWSKSEEFKVASNNNIGSAICLGQISDPETFDATITSKECNKDTESKSITFWPQDNAVIAKYVESPANSRAIIGRYNGDSALPFLDSSISILCNDINLIENQNTIETHSVPHLHASNALDILVNNYHDTNTLNNIFTHMAITDQANVLQKNKDENGEYRNVNVLGLNNGPKDTPAHQVNIDYSVKNFGSSGPLVKTESIKSGDSILVTPKKYFPGSHIKEDASYYDISYSHVPANTIKPNVISGTTSSDINMRKFNIEAEMVSPSPSININKYQELNYPADHYSTIYNEEIKKIPKDINVNSTPYIELQSARPFLSTAQFKRLHNPSLINQVIPEYTLVSQNSEAPCEHSYYLGNKITPISNIVNDNGIISNNERVATAQAKRPNVSYYKTINGVQTEGYYVQGKDNKKNINKPSVPNRFDMNTFFHSFEENLSNGDISYLYHIDSNYLNYNNVLKTSKPNNDIHLNDTNHFVTKYKWIIDLHRNDPIPNTVYVPTKLHEDKIPVENNLASNTFNNVRLSSMPSDLEKAPIEVEESNDSQNPILASMVNYNMQTPPEAQVKLYNRDISTPMNTPKSLSYNTIMKPTFHAPTVEKERETIDITLNAIKSNQNENEDNIYTLQDQIISPDTNHTVLIPNEEHHAIITQFPIKITTDNTVEIFKSNNSNANFNFLPNTKDVPNVDSPLENNLKDDVVQYKQPHSNVYLPIKQVNIVTTPISKYDVETSKTELPCLALYKQFPIYNIMSNKRHIKDTLLPNRQYIYENIDGSIPFKPKLDYTFDRNTAVPIVDLNNGALSNNGNNIICNTMTSNFLNNETDNYLDKLSDIVNIPKYTEYYKINNPKEDYYNVSSLMKHDDFCDIVTPEVNNISEKTDFTLKPMQSKLVMNEVDDVVRIPKYIDSNIKYKKYIEKHKVDTVSDPIFNKIYFASSMTPDNLDHNIYSLPGNKISDQNNNNKLKAMSSTFFNNKANALLDQPVFRPGTDIENVPKYVEASKFDKPNIYKYYFDTNLNPIDKVPSSMSHLGNDCSDIFEPHVIKISNNILKPVKTKFVNNEACMGQPNFETVANVVKIRENIETNEIDDSIINTVHSHTSHDNFHRSDTITPEVNTISDKTDDNILKPMTAKLIKNEANIYMVQPIVKTVPGVVNIPKHFDNVISIEKENGDDSFSSTTDNRQENEISERVTLNNVKPLNFLFEPALPMMTEPMSAIRNVKNEKQCLQENFANSPPEVEFLADIPNLQFVKPVTNFVDLNSYTGKIIEPETALPINNYGIKNHPATNVRLLDTPQNKDTFYEREKYYYLNTASTCVDLKTREESKGIPVIKNKYQKVKLTDNVLDLTEFKKPLNSIITSTNDPKMFVNLNDEDTLMPSRHNNVNTAYTYLKPQDLIVKDTNYRYSDPMVSTTANKRKPLLGPTKKYYNTISSNVPIEAKGTIKSQTKPMVRDSQAYVKPIESTEAVSSISLPDLEATINPAIKEYNEIDFNIPLNLKSTIKSQNSPIVTNSYKTVTQCYVNPIESSEQFRAIPINTLPRNNYGDFESKMDPTIKNYNILHSHVPLGLKELLKSRTLPVLTNLLTPNTGVKPIDSSEELGAIPVNSLPRNYNEDFETKLSSPIKYYNVINSNIPIELRGILKSQTLPIAMDSCEPVTQTHVQPKQFSEKLRPIPIKAIPRNNYEDSEEIMNPTIKYYKEITSNVPQELKSEIKSQTLPLLTNSYEPNRQTDIKPIESTEELRPIQINALRRKDSQTMLNTPIKDCNVIKSNMAVVLKGTTKSQTSPVIRNSYIPNTNTDVKPIVSTEELKPIQINTLPRDNYGYFQAEKKHGDKNNDHNYVVNDNLKYSNILRPYPATDFNDYVITTPNTARHKSTSKDNAVNTVTPFDIAKNLHTDIFSNINDPEIKNEYSYDNTQVNNNKNILIKCTSNPSNLVDDFEYAYLSPKIKYPAKSVEFYQNQNALKDYVTYTDQMVVENSPNTKSVLVKHYNSVSFEQDRLKQDHEYNSSHPKSTLSLRNILANNNFDNTHTETYHLYENLSNPKSIKAKQIDGPMNEFKTTPVINSSSDTAPNIYSTYVPIYNYSTNCKDSVELDPTRDYKHYAIDNANNFNIHIFKEHINKDNIGNELKPLSDVNKGHSNVATPCTISNLPFNQDPKTMPIDDYYNIKRLEKLDNKPVELYDSLDVKNKKVLPSMNNYEMVAYNTENINSIRAGYSLPGLTRNLLRPKNIDSRYTYPILNGKMQNFNTNIQSSTFRNDISNAESDKSDQLGLGSPSISSYSYSKDYNPVKLVSSGNVNVPSNIISYSDPKLRIEYLDMAKYIPNNLVIENYITESSNPYKIADYIPLTPTSPSSQYLSPSLERYSTNVPVSQICNNIIQSGYSPLSFSTSTSNMEPKFFQQNPCFNTRLINYPSFKKNNKQNLPPSTNLPVNYQLNESPEPKAELLKVNPYTTLDNLISNTEFKVKFDRPESIQQYSNANLSKEKDVSMGEPNIIKDCKVPKSYQVNSNLKPMQLDSTFNDLTVPKFFKLANPPLPQAWLTNEAIENVSHDLKANLEKMLDGNNVLHNAILNTNKSENISIPLADICVPKCIPKDVFDVNTTDPYIELKGWNSNLKLVRAKLVLETLNVEVTNFLPIVKKIFKLDPKKVQDIAKDAIGTTFGKPIYVKTVVNDTKPQVVIEDRNLNPGDKYYILWPTLIEQEGQSLACFDIKHV